MTRKNIQTFIVTGILCLMIFPVSAHRISESGNIKQDVRIFAETTSNNTPLATYLSEEKLKAYPNPVSKGGLLIVEIPSDKGEITLFMYNTVGKVVQTLKTSDKKIELNVPQTTGIYLLRFVEKQKVFAVEKIVVKE